MMGPPGRGRGPPPDGMGGPRGGRMGPPGMREEEDDSGVFDKDVSQLDFCTANGDCDAWKNLRNYPVTQSETSSLICNLFRSSDTNIPK